MRTSSSPLRSAAALAVVTLIAACDEPFTPIEPAICAMDPEVRLALPCSTEPRRIADDPGFVALAGGQEHTCGLTADGEAYCWGHSFFGAHPPGPRPPLTRPRRVEGGYRFAGLTAGAHHACGWTEEGAGFCWGSNVWAELGTGSDQPNDDDRPVPITGGIRFSTLSAAVRHTCGITQDGRAFCWGTDWFSQLGRGVFDMGVAPAPAAVVGGHTFGMIAAGMNSTCALTPAGEAFCWGMGHSGELGTRSIGRCREIFLTFPCSPVPVPVDTPRRFTSLHTGSSHSCGLTAQGEAYCWGDPGQGQTGPAPRDPFVPTAVPGYRFRLLSAGGATTCGVTVAGETVCWGLNHFGQLGTGSVGYASGDPAPVRGGHRFRTLAIGGSHACGVTEQGHTYCWGSNERGQLGTGVW